jgi:capsular polysaccharide biosynthesis protein
MGSAYQASISLFVSDAVQPNVTNYTSIMTSERLVKAQGGWLKGRLVLNEVMQDLSLDADAEGLAGRWMSSW